MSNNKNNKYYTIYGINNSVNFLKARLTCDYLSIYVNNNSIAIKKNNLLKLINNLNLKIDYLDNKIFNKKFNYKHNQGIIIEFNASLTKNINNINNFSNNACFIICDQLTDPQNLGQIIRTAECAGINGVILPKHGSAHLSDSVLQVSQGAIFNLDVFIETNLNNTIKFLKDNGFWIVGVENSIDAQDWYEIDYKGKTVIVVGSEGSGMRSLIKKSCDFLTTIPMKGKINSLNVSAALSAILFERQRQLDSIK